MKKIFLLLIVLMISLVGCKQKELITSENPEATDVKDEQGFVMLPSPGSIDEAGDSDANVIVDSIMEYQDDDEVDITDFLIPEPTAPPIDYNQLSEDNYRIRSVIEALKISNQNIWRNEHKSEFGIEYFFILNDLYHITANENISSILYNEDFINEVYKEHGVEIEHYFPKEEYLFGILLAGTFDNKPYYFIYGGCGEDYDIYWVAVNSYGKSNAEEVAEVYARMDGLDLCINETGENEIYYYTGNGDTFLIDLIGDAKRSTVYFWDQNNILGVIIVPGEHAEENFDYCDYIEYE